MLNKHPANRETTDILHTISTFVLSSHFKLVRLISGNVTNCSAEAEFVLMGGLIFFPCFQAINRRQWEWHQKHHCGTYAVTISVTNDYTYRLNLELHRAQ